LPNLHKRVTEILLTEVVHGGTGVSVNNIRISYITEVVHGMTVGSVSLHHIFSSMFVLINKQLHENEKWKMKGAVHP
jgi:uncharacterized membrane protein